MEKFRIHVRLRSLHPSVCDFHTFPFMKSVYISSTKKYQHCNEFWAQFTSILKAIDVHFYGITALWKIEWENESNFNMYIGITLPMMSMKFLAMTSCDLKRKGEL